MRALPLAAAAALALSACGNNDQTDNTQNVDENLSAENIVSNDVTAIDAVTGDAANMAADVNYEDFDANIAATANSGSASPHRKKPSSTPSSASPASSNTAASSTNVAANATQ